MNSYDNLGPAILTFALSGLIVLVVGCAALWWWTAKFKPSRAAAWAGWSAFLWAYGTLVRAMFTPVGLILQTVLVAAGWGVLVVASVWLAGRSASR
jgi:hypothetical protein